MLLQRKAQTLDDRLPEPSGVRRPNEISLGCRQPNRVQASEGTIGVKTVREMILGDTVRLGQPPPHAPRRIDIADPKGSIAVINIYRVLERLQREIAKH